MTARPRLEVSWLSSIPDGLRKSPCSDSKLVRNVSISPGFEYSHVGSISISPGFEYSHVGSISISPSFFSTVRLGASLSLLFFV